MVIARPLRRPGAFDIFNLVVLLLFSVTTLYPFVNLLFISVSGMDEVVKASGMMLVPKSIDFSGYRYVFRYAGLLDAYRVTLFITVVGTIVNLVLTALGAYTIAEKAIPGRKFLTTLVLIPLFFSGGLIPTYLVVNALGLVDSLWSLILPGAINTFLLLITRNFFLRIPLELKESARIDGASEVRTMLSVVLPLSRSILATLALFYGVAHWNEYTNAILYINSPRNNPLQVLIRGMYNMAIMEVDMDHLPPPVETVRCATVMITTLPIIAVYPFLQRYFVHGLLVGSIKG